MSWAVGYDDKWQRDIGYGVPAYCDHPKCVAEIDRGLGHVCGGEAYGGEKGCGLFFCSSHLFGSPQRCKSCLRYSKKDYAPKPDHPDWITHKLTDDSWQEWREKHPDEVVEMRKAVKVYATEGIIEMSGRS